MSLWRKSFWVNYTITEHYRCSLGWQLDSTVLVCFEVYQQNLATTFIPFHHAVEIVSNLENTFYWPFATKFGDYWKSDSIFVFVFCVFYFVWKSVSRLASLHFHNPKTISSLPGRSLLSLHLSKLSKIWLLVSNFILCYVRV